MTGSVAALIAEAKVILMLPTDIDALWIIVGAALAALTASSFVSLLAL